MHDAASLTDDIEDLLALLSLLDENIGVSNTNMHLRASLGLGSRVMVQTPGGDWRWGVEGNASVWFTESVVYRQTNKGEWDTPLQTLQHDLQAKFGVRKTSDSKPFQPSAIGHHQTSSKRLIWLTAGAIRQVDGKQASDLASARYRVIAPSQRLAELGWQSEFLNEEVSLVMGGWGSAAPKAGDTLIISKVFGEHSLKLANDAQSRGASVIVDFCDNFLDHPKRGPLQHQLLKLADEVIAASDGMAYAIKKHGYQVDAVISDPVEMSYGIPLFAPNETLELLWFGHAVNIDTLKEFLPCLAEYSRVRSLHLNVVTTLPNGKADLDRIVPADLSVTYNSWSVDATLTAIDNCDIVIIPVLASQFKMAKSPNRLLEPLQRGRMVVAGPLPAYLPFGDSALVVENLIEGIEWCLAHPAEVLTRIHQGQADIEKYHTEQAIGQQWDALLNSMQPKQAIQITDKANNASIVTQGVAQDKIDANVKVQEVALLTMQHPKLPSIAIRLIEPLTKLDAYNIKIASGISNQKLSIDYQALLMRDTIIVQRDFPSDETLALLKKLKALGKKLVYETDDAFHLIPENHSKAFHRAKAPAIFEFAKLADVIAVSTEKLAEEFNPYGTVKVLPNLLSSSLWNSALLGLTKQNRTKHSLEHLRIGVVGGADHQLDLALLTEAVQAIVKSNNRIDWVAYGDGAIKLLKPLVPANQLSVVKSNFDYPSHPNRLAEMALDLALVPLNDDNFNSCRSNLKLLEFGFLGIPCVYSNTPSYNQTVVDGETGLLVNNTTENWVNAIKQLIENPALRKKIGANAQQEIQTNWMLTNQNNGWQALLDGLS